MKTDDNISIKPLPIQYSLGIFAFWSVAIYLAVENFIPYFSNNFKTPLIVAWFLSSGIFIFIPIFFFSFWGLKKEGNKLNLRTILLRMRLKRLHKEDIILISAAIVFNFIMIGLIPIVYNFLSDLTGLFYHISLSPPFMKYEGLTPENYWILLVWIPFFFFNIVGEELYWHGYILPAQELVHGKMTWYINGLFWLMFHYFMGLEMILVLIPLIFSISYLVQKKKNLWYGIIIHGVVNGSGFLLISFGVV